jgi:transcriptional regulator with XRE-family HTH domain
MRDEDVNRIVGLKLKFFREQKGMTQKDFCESVGLQQAHYSLLEKGVRSLGMYALKSLVDKYSLNVNWLLGTSGTMVDYSTRIKLSPAEENQKLRELLKENNISF